MTKNVTNFFTPNITNHEDAVKLSVQKALNNQSSPLQCQIYYRKYSVGRHSLFLNINYVYFYISLHGLVSLIIIYSVIIFILDFSLVLYFQNQIAKSFELKYEVFFVYFSAEYFSFRSFLSTCMFRLISLSSDLAVTFVVKLNDKFNNYNQTSALIRDNLILNWQFCGNVFFQFLHNLIVRQLFLSMPYSSVFS